MLCGTRWRQTLGKSKYARLAWALLLAVPLYACGGSGSTTTPPTPSTPSPTTTTFQGTVAAVSGDIGQSGTITVTVQTVIALADLRPLSVALASGSFRATHFTNGQSVVLLTGTYDSSTGSLTMSGGGYTFTGSVNGGVFAGTLTGPGIDTGTFSTVNGASATTYCGTYFSVVPIVFTPNFGGAVHCTYTEHGIFNVQIASSGLASGMSMPTFSSLVPDGNTGTNCGSNPPPKPGFVTGQLTGSLLTLRSSEGGSTTLATVQNGILNATTVSPGGLGTGTLSATTSACQ